MSSRTPRPGSKQPWGTQHLITSILINYLFLNGEKHLPSTLRYSWRHKSSLLCCHWGWFPCNVIQLLNTAVKVSNVSFLLLFFFLSLLSFSSSSLSSFLRRIGQFQTVKHITIYIKKLQAVPPFDTEGHNLVAENPFYIIMGASGAQLIFQTWSFFVAGAVL